VSAQHPLGEGSGERVKIAGGLGGTVADLMREDG